MDTNMLANTLEERVAAFNSAIKNRHYHLLFDGKATQEDLQKIKNCYTLPLPADLENFYKEYGGLSNRSGEDYDIRILPASKHLKNLNEKYIPCRSLGLIDYIKFTWGNNRKEFDEQATKEEIDFLNTHYQCIGSYNKGWGVEESYFLYFDKDGYFGEVRYHQDEFDKLWEEHLNEMLEKSPAHESFWDILERLLIETEEALLIELKDDDDEDGYDEDNPPEPYDRRTAARIKNAQRSVVLRICNKLIALILPRK